MYVLFTRLGVHMYSPAVYCTLRAAVVVLRRVGGIRLSLASLSHWSLLVTLSKLAGLASGQQTVWSAICTRGVRVCACRVRWFCCP